MSIAERPTVMPQEAYIEYKDWAQHIKYCIQTFQNYHDYVDTVHAAGKDFRSVDERLEAGLYCSQFFIEEEEGDESYVEYCKEVLEVVALELTELYAFREQKKQRLIHTNTGVVPLRAALVDSLSAAESIAGHIAGITGWPEDVSVREGVTDLLQRVQEIKQRMSHMV